MPDNSPDADLRGKNRFECRSCPYQYVLDRRYYERKSMKRKEVEDVLGGKDSWENVDQTEVQCPNPQCGGERAYFYQIQIRSADEPMTSFFKVRRVFRSYVLAWLEADAELTRRATVYQVRETMEGVSA